jgi:hypothetical protein
MADQIVTYGYGTQDLIITGGYFSSGSDVFNRVISALEKKNVSVSWIDSAYCKDGLADHTLLDEIIGRLES